MIRSSDELYRLIEAALENITVPQTCADLMDRPEIRAAALNKWGSDVQHSTNKLSDLLGFMWRRQLIDRFSAPPSRSMARYAYALKDKFSDYDTPIKYTPPEIPPLGKHALSIVEKNGEVILDFQQFTIVIRPK